MHKRLTRKAIVAACRAKEPSPEHGVGQYSEVVSYMLELGEPLLSMELTEAVTSVFLFMNM
jgi:hypothetical protein